MKAYVLEKQLFTLRDRIKIVKKNRKATFKEKGVSYLLVFMIIYFLAIYFF